MADGKLTPDDRASASLVAAIAGENPWQSPSEALQFCIDATEGKPRKEIRMNNRILWGNKAERIGMEMGLELLGLPINDIVFDWTFDKAFDHPTLPLSCSLDGLYNIGHKRFPVRSDPARNIYTPNDDTLYLIGQGVIENKMTGMFPDGNVLPEWRGKIQAATACEILGLAWYMVTVNYQNEPYVYVYERDPEFAKFLNDLIVDFDRRVKEKDYYEPVNSLDCNLIWPNARADQIELEDDLAWRIEEIKDYEQAIKEYKQTIDDHETVIKSQMKESKNARCGSFNVIYGSRTYKAKPERIMPAKPAYTIRSKKLSIREVKNEIE